MVEPLSHDRPRLLSAACRQCRIFLKAPPRDMIIPLSPCCQRRNLGCPCKGHPGAPCLPQGTGIGAAGKSGRRRDHPQGFISKNATKKRGKGSPQRDSGDATATLNRQRPKESTNEPSDATTSDARTRRERPKAADRSTQRKQDDQTEADQNNVDKRADRDNRLVFQSLHAGNMPQNIPSRREQNSELSHAGKVYLKFDTQNKNRVR